MLSLYFASAGGGGGLIITAFISLIWLPSHYIFKWLYDNHRSDSTFENSINACFILSVLLFLASIWLGDHNQAGGHGDDVIIWLMGLFWAVGIWGGFATGYMKERIIK